MFFIGTRDDEGEFFAAVAGCHAVFADSFSEGAPDSDEDFVACVVTVGFVELSEVVYVNHDDADFVVVTTDIVALLREEFVEGAVVAEAGERVGGGHCFRAFEQQSGFYDQGELFGDGVMEVAFEKKRFVIERIEEFEVTEFLVGDLQREKRTVASIPDFPGCHASGIAGGFIEWDIDIALAFVGGCYGV